MCDSIARCFSVYGSLYRLWIDSGEYEEYAKKKLLDSKGEVNVLGMKLAKELSLQWPTYYWWFHDTDDGKPTHCPCCGDQLNEEVFWGTGKCDNCRVIV
ncbi:DUF2310 family Zn-ribbon-containing protein [Endozoicomonas sp. SM1973]|uniref:DUF2310 family Zn-ribbon-containing protein n=1 Tax=Spartinivicinus marinus TaxID=2994442 RepID=A0A853I6L6_9GAMM|nr:DUF2310 family Zn-ribbon-containing protein [Spartinivicinus marinus]MCX4030338.1 DUF2310 family Zn-ribbon-containing protein [Spartinivicinus marinus]NYZ69550.1 DUF2310 family Zn-ribbon-containing protein [Spartinivicinus marinus]